MAGETGRPSDKPNTDRNHADTQKSSIVSEDVRSLAAGLAQKLRAANIDCEILPVVPIDGPPIDETEGIGAWCDAAAGAKAPLASRHRQHAIDHGAGFTQVIRRIA